MLEDTFPSYIDSQEFREYVKYVEGLILEKERKKKRKERTRFQRLSSLILDSASRDSERNKNVRRNRTPEVQ